MRSGMIVIIVILVILGAGGYYLGTQNVSTPPSASEAPAASPAVEPAPQPAASGIPAGATEATIEYVHDGDTVFLTDGRKVSMLGINTPEIGQYLECYGDEATTLLRQLLPEGTHVSVLSDVEPLDQYGRSLLFIYLDDGTNVNLEMLRQGAAEVEMYRPNLLFQSEIEATERAAIAVGDPRHIIQRRRPQKHHKVAKADDA